MDTGEQRTYLEFTVPTRGLSGVRSRILTATNGTAIIHHNFYEYENLRGSVPGRTSGVLISADTGAVTAYAIENLADRGMFFVKPGDQVYAGQVVGEHNRENDIEVNVCRLKKLTNVRAVSAEKLVVLKPPREMTLEMALEYIEDDELVEITPDDIRMRKRLLSEAERRRVNRNARAVAT
jgi:GTP-binding protein